MTPTPRKASVYAGIPLITFLLSVVPASAMSGMDHGGHGGSGSGGMNTGGFGGHGHGATDDPQPTVSRGYSDVYFGTLGPWHAEGIIEDHRRESHSSEQSMEAPPTTSRHISFALRDDRNGKPLKGAAGKVTVTGPDGRTQAYPMVSGNDGRIGADLDMSVPGARYDVKVEITSGEETASTAFPCWGKQ